MSKHQLWAQRIADWRASGLSQRAFCQQQGLALSTFCVWLRKIRQINEQSIRGPSAFLPMVIQDKPEAFATTITVNTNGLSFDCSVGELAQLITELNRHA